MLRWESPPGARPSSPRSPGSAGCEHTHHVTPCLARSPLAKDTSMACQESACGLNTTEPQVLRESGFEGSGRIWRGACILAQSHTQIGPCSLYCQYKRQGQSASVRLQGVSEYACQDSDGRRLASGLSVSVPLHAFCRRDCTDAVSLSLLHQICLQPCILHVQAKHGVREHRKLRTCC